MTAPTKTNVAAVVWPWREKLPDTGKLAAAARRKHAAIEGAVMCAVGLLLALVFHKAILSAVVFSLAALVLIGGLVIPPLYHGFKAAGQGLGKAVGIAFSWILLVPFFFICFTGGRLILLITGNDPLQRKFQPELKTYWSERKPISGPEHYSRQY